MRVLIFEPSLSGHHLEYLQHLYNGAVGRLDCEFVFAVPHEEWSRMKGKCSWPEARNISFLMLDDSECQGLGGGSMLAQSWKVSRYVRRIARQCDADRVLLISLAGAIPFLPILLPNRVKLSGIIYKIYLRAPKHGLRKWLDKVRYTIMAHGRSMGKVFILNDQRSAKELNLSYNSDKFISLPDPVPNIVVSALRNLRQDMNIQPDSKMFLHFGAMDERKGTLEILKALCLMTKDELADKVFVFAGRVGQKIKADFYHLADKARSTGANIIVRDEFCEYGYLNDLCHTADCILIPYLFTDLSSGALGYAAVHHTPVIGPASGLIGELISDNSLGECVDKISAETLKKAICEFSYNANDCFSKYAEDNSSLQFVNTIIDNTLI